MTGTPLAERPATRRPSGGGGTTFRPEIQALRALAMAGVVLFHLWPARLTGGYIGVDVFFVISGYLISSHLLREIDSTGRVSLTRFYARRARRLLPAAMLVLAVTAVATLLLVPADVLSGFLLEIAASAVYVVNWVLAVNAVDYFAADGAESPVQHYWSLSVEEQFYLVWPLLFLLVALAVRRRVRTRALVAVVVTLLVACLAYSIVLTASSPQFAYFSSPAHAWQFAAGGLLALLQRRLDSSRWPQLRHTRALLLWVGLAGIVLTMLAFGPTTPVPGWIALFPTAATVAVIAAGASSSPLAPTGLMQWRPVQVAGDISYSAYLWHWPLIVLTPYVLGRDLAWPDKLVLLALTVLAAWATRRFVEQPPLRSTWWRPRRASFGFAAVSAAVVVALCVVPMLRLQQTSDAAAEAVVEDVAETDACLGAPALQRVEECRYALSLDPDLVIESPGYEELAIEAAEGTGATGDCGEGPHGSEVCSFDSGEPDAPTIALVGDSHAEHFLPALALQAGTQGWDVEVHTKRSCPIVEDGWRATGAASYRQNDQDCIDWRAAIVPQLAQDPDLDVVVAATYSHRVGLDGTPELRASLAASFERTWTELETAGKEVLVVGDTPLAIGDDVGTCLSEGSALDCSISRDQALPPDPIRDSVTDSGATLLDLTDDFCDAERCYAAIGGLAVYDDLHHLTPTFSLTLADSFTRAVEDELEDS